MQVSLNSENGQTVSFILKGVFKWVFAVITLLGVFHLFSWLCCPWHLTISWVKQELPPLSPCHLALINRAWVCMGESWHHWGLRLACTHDLGQDSPIQTDRLSSVNKMFIMTNMKNLILLRFVLANILFANGDELNLILQKSARHLCLSFLTCLFGTSINKYFWKKTVHILHLTLHIFHRKTLPVLMPFWMGKTRPLSISISAIR